MSDDEIAGIIRSNNGGKLITAYGPTKMANMMVWEVWTRTDLEYFTRFIVKRPGEKPYYFSDFHQLCGFIDTEINDHQIRKGHFYVAAAAFMMILVTMIYLTIARPDSRILNAMLSIFAGAAAYFFGKHVKLNWPSSSS